MPNHLEHLARRLEDDPFFLACPLRLYAKSEELGEGGLAEALKCSKEALMSVRLCRAPSPDESFFECIERIATRFAANAEALAEAVRRGQALFQMAQVATTSRILLAARDGDAKGTGNQGNGGRR
jgi:hypothetical protein